MWIYPTPAHTKSLWDQCRLWLLAEIYSTFPEVGDPEKPMSEAAIAAEESGFGRIGRWVGLILGPALALGLGIVLIGLSLTINAATHVVKARGEAAWT